MNAWLGRKVISNMLVKQEFNLTFDMLEYISKISEGFLLRYWSGTWWRAVTQNLDILIRAVNTQTDSFSLKHYMNFLHTAV